MCWWLVDTIYVCRLKYLHWIVLSCSVSQTPSRQDPPTGPPSGDHLWMGVLCVPTRGWVGMLCMHQCVVCCVSVVCNSEGAYTYSDVCTPHFAEDLEDNV